MQEKMKMENKLIITPQTKVAQLLDAYPELEDLLIEISPAFKKLRNPILRKTIAKITSLEQAAAVGGVSMDIVINKMRTAVGQDKLENLTSGNRESNGAPDWFASTKIAKTFDTRPKLSRGEHPIGEVMREIAQLASGEMLEVITPFFPAPMVDQVAEKGFATWTKQESPELFRNYFAKL